MVKCCSNCKKTKGDDQFNSINFRRKNAVVKKPVRVAKKYHLSPKQVGVIYRI